MDLLDALQSSLHAAYDRVAFSFITDSPLFLFFSGVGFIYIASYVFSFVRLVFSLFVLPGRSVCLSLNLALALTLPFPSWPF